MRNVLKLAWRNLWRNPRRTLIIGSSVLFSALFCILMQSFVNGSCNYIIDLTVEQQTGMFQIQHPDYWEDKRPDNFMQANEELLTNWEEDPSVKHLAPRIQSFAIAWNGNKSRNISLQGIDLKREALFSHLDKQIINGKYLRPDEEQILIGSRMAEILQLTVGDTLTLIGQGYHGESANGLFVIGGIIKAFDPLLDAGVVYMPLSTARRFISMPDGATYVAVTLTSKREIDETMTRFKSDHNEFAYRPWKELIGSTMAGAANDKKQMMVYIYFLYLIVGFGLLSTIIMLTNERRKEFGVMMALGTKRRTLFGSLLTEVSLIATISIGVSTLVAYPIIAYFHYYPPRLGGEIAKAMEEIGYDAIMPFDLTPELFYIQALIVAVLVLLVMLYPLGRIHSMKVINALKD